MKDDGRFYGALLHLSYNMWCDRRGLRDLNEKRRYPIPDDITGERRKKLEYEFVHNCHSPELTFDEDVFWRIAAKMAKAGMNFILIDVGDGFAYPSHPEIAVKGAWSPDKMRQVLARLRGMGLEPMPKLNFSATHDAWMGKYSRMVSTKPYYQAVGDLIGDLCEVFKPRLFHIGWDEEDDWHQAAFDTVVIRQGDLWWHDFLFTVKEVEKRGVRAWAWSDKIWQHKDEFLKKWPKSVLCSNWFYLPKFDYPEGHEFYPMYKAYEWLEAAGYDQIPCCSTCGGWRLPTGNPVLTANHVKTRIAPERLKGLLTAPWARTIPLFEDWLEAGIDQTAPAVEILRAGLAAAT